MDLNTSFGIAKQQSISEYIIKIRLKKAYVFKIIIGSHAETHAEGKGK